MPEGHEDSSPSDLSTERNPEKPLINLADLKNEIFIPLVQLYIHALTLRIVYLSYNSMLAISSCKSEK